jgi:hypothetical protein
MGGRVTRLTGVPGACSASPDTSDTKYLAIQSASTTRAALLSSGGDSPAVIYRSDVGETVYLLDEEAIAITISPSGSYFAALSSSRLSLYRRGEANALAAATVPIEALPVPLRDIRGLLVGDFGDLVLQSDAGFWFSNAPPSAARFTFVSRPLTSMRFAPRDRLLLGFEPGQGRVIAVHPQASFAMEPLLEASAIAGFTPRLEFSADGFTFWISRQDGTLVRYDLLRREATFYRVTAGSIAAVIAPGIFLWDKPDSQLAVLDTTQPGEPRVLLVPSAESHSAK